MNFKIFGGNPIHGEIYLHGDYLNAIENVLEGLLQGVSFEVLNAPRSLIFLNFLKFIEGIGIEYLWKSESSISFKNDSSLPVNISSLDEDEKYKFLKLVVAPVVIQNGLAVINSKSRSTAKFYRNIGFKVEPDKDTLRIVGKPESESLELKTYTDEFELLAVKLLLKNVTANGEKTYETLFNQHELRFFSALSAYSSGEVALSGFDITQSLNFLMQLSEIGFDYQVDKGRIRIWKNNKSSDENFDWQKNDAGEVGYKAVLRTLYGRKSTTALVKNDIQIKHLVRNLNILGCKLSLDELEKNLVLIIRPSQILPRKMNVMDYKTGGCFLASLIFASGNAILEDVQILSERIPDLLDNLNAIHVNISVI